MVFSDIGISMWNSVIALDCNRGEKDNIEVVVKVRHVAADCIYIAITVLGGVSARFDIDDVSLLKFYTACGKKYASDLSDIDMAEVCYQKASEFHDSIAKSAKDSKYSSKALARAVFDLLLGRAECAWERGEHAIAEQLVGDARKHLELLPEEVEYLASVEYNFGLFMYQAKETQRALNWLNRSFETRGSPHNASKDLEKQAKTARLAAVCLLTLSKFEEAKTLMEKAETIYHDSVGAYLLLKIAVVTKTPNAKALLSGILEDRESNLDVCMASVALVADAQILSEAVDGYEAIFKRFSTHVDALLTKVGPRYFESLIATGRLTEAVHVLDQCSDLITQHMAQVGNGEAEQKSSREHFRRWSAIALTSGCTLADRQDFSSATLMLDRALRITNKMQSVKGKDDSISDIVEQNEAAICRLLAACAICHSSKADKPDAEMGDADGNEQRGVQDNQTLLAAAIANARRARDIDPDDFAARLLLFRGYLLQDRPDMASAEMSKASAEIPCFDAGSLAEAACAAQDAGSNEAVLSALKCIMNLSEDALRKTLVESTNHPHPGFFGSVLVSFTSILLKGRGNSNDDSDSQDSNDDPGDVFCPSEEAVKEISTGLSSGVTAIRSLGLGTIFGPDAARRESVLKYLADVAWNCGRDAGQKEQHTLWTLFFDVCYELNTFREDTPEVRKNRRVAKIMAAISIIENDKKEEQDLQLARKRLEEANALSRALPASPNPASDPMNQLLVLLQARCFVALGDDDALAVCVANVCQTTDVDARILEQLAAVCLDQPQDTSKISSESRARRNEMAALLLNAAVDFRLRTTNDDLVEVAITLRQLIGTEVARGELGNRSFQALSRATGLIKEKAEAYPADERRWLAATAWDRAQMLGRTNKKAEAKRWAQSAIDIASTDPALATYIPRITIYRDSLTSPAEEE